MSEQLIRIALIFCLSYAIPPAHAQKKPVMVPGCELSKNPKNFDGKVIQVRGRLNVHFEDFTLGVDHCDSTQWIWLAFGGDVPGIVASMANDNFRKPGENFEINGGSYGITKDENFRRLYALIASRHGEKADYEVTATLTGAFFAGEENKDANGKVTGYMGYGHLGCCSLFVITQVADVASVPAAKLNVHGVVTGPDGKPVEGFVVFDDVLGGYPPERQTAATDKEGRFAFTNSGQQLRFENPKYRPLAITAEPGDAAVQVKLENAERSDWVVPACDSGDFGGRAGFSVLFAIPVAMEAQRPDDEDLQKSLFVTPKGGSAAEAQLIISHDADEANYAEHSLDSKWFEERWIKNSAGKVMGMDQRGQWETGSFWRRARFFDHDVVIYWLRPGEQPEAYDKIIDSACVAGK